MDVLEPLAIEEAFQSLPPALKNTPLVASHDGKLLFKLETFQPTGAYKARAAWTVLQRLGKAAKQRGVALSSSGNFAAAFTWAAHRLGVPAHLVLTPSTSPYKLALAQRYPCTLHVCDDRYEARYELLQELNDQGILTIDHRFNLDVFLGHATIGWECAQFLAQNKHHPPIANLERILIPVSTGGLALSIASALRSYGYRQPIFGVCPQGNPTLYNSWQAGYPIATKRASTCCDALTATSIPDRVFSELKKLLDDILVVSETSIPDAVRHLASQEGLVVEPGAAVSLAALQQSLAPEEGSLLILSGRNIDPKRLAQYLSS